MQSRLMPAIGMLALIVGTGTAGITAQTPEERTS